MERKRIIYFISAAIVLFFISTTIPWYFRENEPILCTIGEKTKYPDVYASEHFKDYDPERDYYKIEKSVISISRGAIPFTYDKEVVKTLPTEYSSIKH